MGDLKLSSQNLDEHPESQDTSEFKPESLSTDTLNQLIPEDVPNTILKTFKRQLPKHLTRGIQKLIYKPQLSRYPMSHYISNHRLSKSNQSFMNQLSTVSIPNCVQKALVDPRWKAAMNEEMASLQKN